ncbi:MAG: CapA family protein [Candidatus Paceibacterota bacterium]|jgi:poly-gamma-glutamate synthesis protein (capsule biosynthesis protein)
MDDEFNSFKFSHVIVGIFLLIFGWGLFWAGSQGIKVAWNEFGSIKYSFTSTDSVAAPFPVTTKMIEADNTADSNLSIMIGGDVMYDRNIRKIAEKVGYDTLLSSVSPLFKKADIAVVNVEGPITSNKSKTLLPDGKTTKILSFTFDPATASALRESGIDVVSLANNHTDNMGIAGFNETKKWLTEAGVKYFGTPWNSTSTEVVITKNGISVAFVGYHAFQSGLDRVVKDIKRLSSMGYFVIVMPHWGEEYVSKPSADLIAKAETLTKAGAGAIIGAHPHVIMDQSWIGKVPVLYSIGNLLFDQYFSADVMKGQIVELRLKKSGNVVSIDTLKVHATALDRTKGVILVDPKSAE